MKFAIRTYFLTALLIAAAAISNAAGDAGRESQFSIGSSVRSVGMGGGFVGMADDASAVFWNQAALGLIQEQEFNFMHTDLFEGSIYDVASYVYPHPKFGGFGVSLMRLGTGDIVRRVDWNESGEFEYYIAQMMLAYGRRLGGNLYFGSALKIVNQSLDNSSTYGVGLDISIYSPFYKKLSAGLLLQDIVSPQLRLREDEESLPKNILAGVGIRDISFSENLRHNLNFGLEKPEDRSLRLHTGLETTYRERLDLRFGYDRDNLAFGLGVLFGRVRFDYAYKVMDGITDSHRLGLSLKLGLTVREKVQREMDLQDARGSYLVMDDRRQQFDYYQEQGDGYFRSGNLDSAFVYYNRALAYRESDKYVKGRVAMINQMRLKATEQETEVVSEELLQQSLMDGYHVRATELFDNGKFVPALGIVDLAQRLDNTDKRFADLRENINVGIDSSVVRLLNEAEKAEKDGRLPDAVVAYNKILMLSPDDITVKELIGRVGEAISLAQLLSDGVESFYLGRLSSAEAKFNKALELSPKNIVANEYLNRISALQQKPTDQADLEKDEKVWKIYLNALGHYRNGEYEQAIEMWQEVLKYYPGNEQTLNNITQARLRLQSKE